MRYFVQCRTHPEERVYITFKPEQQPPDRSQVAAQFWLKCNLGALNIYRREEVFAEPGPTWLVGAAVGALMFFLDPIVGIAAAIGGAVGVRATEEAAAQRFNGGPTPRILP